MDVQLSHYDYYLPEEKIAKFPLENRDDSKLLFYKKGNLEHHCFKEISKYIPPQSTLIFNDTKVIPARLYFYKSTGALIEIFLLQPLNPLPVLKTMQQKTNCTWLCMIGNVKKWKDLDILQRTVKVNGKDLLLNAELINRKTGTTRFYWDNNNVSFADILEASGEVPLPPYLNRKPNKDDKSRYQTIYSKNEGAVAAPTAGLHFTENILKELENAGITKEYVTLHVSAGTFQPVKEENVVEHPMHSETIIFKKEAIYNLLNHKRSIIPVGTTSMRSLESLYWFGVKLLLEENAIFNIQKLDPYKEYPVELPTRYRALQAILDHMNQQNISEIYGSTEIFILPGYKFKMCDGLITNFHQPKSTLILLIAAFIGEDWKHIYAEALEKDYRFLSFGDSSLLLP